MHPARRFLVVTSLVAVILAGCSSASKQTDVTSTAPAATTTQPARYTTTVTREIVVDSAYRQGLARTPSGWAFSVNDGLFLTDDALHQIKALTPAIPAAWKAQGYDHIGDIDVENGVLYAPLEQPNYSLKHQAMLEFDAATLAYRRGVELPQHQNSFVTVDPATNTAYTMDEFGGAALLRYRATDWKPLPPLRLSRFVDKVQGADLHGGAAWMSTDDARKGVYRVDLRTGATQALGSIGHLDGEGEGIDATPVDGIDLRVLSIDAKIVPVRLVELRVSQPN
jgi:hypothetical protein